MYSKKLSKRKQSLEFTKKFARITVLAFCTAGFVYQTLQFLSFYRTYPTVVDIQQTSPSYLEIPAFTICNPIGYNFTSICTDFGTTVCFQAEIIPFAQKALCGIFTDVCVNGKMPHDYRPIVYGKFLTEVKMLSINGIHMISMKLEDYMKCTIHFSGSSRSCNMENVMGSFFTKDAMPQVCYTIYSLWGQVNRNRERIPKGAVMKFEFSLNASRRHVISEQFNEWVPLFNIPTSPYVQIAVHSPYFLPSPYLEGTSYHGGKSYEMRITMSEKNLLPLPYQTNCTNYMKKWKENGGRGPNNQLNVVQECRVKKWHSAVGCVPVTVDYPHSYDICGTETATNPNNTVLVTEDECTMLADSFNQPCHSISYLATKEERDITISKPINIRFFKQSEDLRTTIPFHDCAGKKVWNPECSILDIEILFDRFEITNLTYNAKYESLELFSVFGGYMGMWLGISLITIYDFVGSVLVYLSRWGMEKHRKRATRLKKRKNAHLPKYPVLEVRKMRKKLQKF